MAILESGGDSPESPPSKRSKPPPSTMLIASLSNLGNTCFLNSVLYVLRFTPGFRQELHSVVQQYQVQHKKSGKHKDKTHHTPNGLLSPPGGSLVGGSNGLDSLSLSSSTSSSEGRGSKDGELIIKLHQVFRELFLSEKSTGFDDPYEPMDFLRSLRSTTSAYESGEQQDAHEFLLFLLDYLRSAEGAKPRTPSPLPSSKGGRKSPSGAYPKPDPRANLAVNGASCKNFLTGGTLVMETECLECENRTQKEEEFIDITVPIPEEDGEGDDDDGQELDDPATCFLRTLMEEAEILQGTEKYWCTFCQRLNEARRSVSYSVLPDVLILHLKRFTTHGPSAVLPSKVSSYLPTPLRLPCFCRKCWPPLPPKSPEPSSQPCLPLDLFGVIFHQGTSTSSGHYIALVRLDEQRRMCVNGGSVPPPQHQGGIQKFFSRKESSSCCEAQACCGVCQLSSEKRSPSPGSNPLSSMWIKCDDHLITAFSEQQVVDALKENSPLGTPYVLFYSRKYSPPVSPPPLLSLNGKRL